jgi:maltose alpha-D-glucosyltransferase/alpha-amylase
MAGADEPLQWSMLGAEQSNSSLVFRAADGTGRMTLKLMRRIQSGENPELEIGRVLSDGIGFDAAPKLAGSIEFRSECETITLAIAHAFVANEGDAWNLTLDAVSSFLEHALARQTGVEAPATFDFEKLASSEFRPTDMAAELIGRYLELAEQLGKRTAQLHEALGTRTEMADFAPEPFTDHYRRALYQAILGRLTGALQLIGKVAGSFSDDTATYARRLIEMGPALTALLRPLMKERIVCKRIRIHGDYHLGQVLFTGNDFVIIDFEGEPARPISERRIKRSPLVDVAGMLRSFDYAAQTILQRTLKHGSIREDQRSRPVEAISYWTRWVEASYLSAYFRHAEPSGLLPQTPAHRRLLVTCYLLEKGTYEIGYEINNRPEWAWIPICGLLRLLDTLNEPQGEGDRSVQAN